MFFLLAIAVGIGIAIALGGRPARIIEFELRRQWLVIAALGIQIVLFTQAGDGLPSGVVDAAHLGSYVLLLGFAAANRRTRALWLLLAGLALNATTILANGGRMPLASSAAEAAGITARANVSLEADHLRLLGDVFALPAYLPLATAFSIGDLLIATGMVLLIVHASMASATEPILRFGRLHRPLDSADLRHLFSGRLVSVCGDWLTTAVLVGWIYNSTGSTLKVALLLLVRIAPPILGGSVAAIVADKLPKKTLLIGVELGRCAVVCGALASVVMDSLVGVVACTALSGALAALTTSIVPALIPVLVPRDRYAAANGLLGVIENGGMALGALAGGLALRYFGASGALALDALSFIGAAALFAGMRIAGVPTADQEEGQTRSALRYVLGKPRLVAAVGCFAAAIIATGLANATLPRLLRGDLDVGPGAYGYGLAAIAVGLTLGQLAVGLTRVGEQGIRWLGTALALMAGLFAMLALVNHAPTAFLLLAAIGFVDGTTDGVFDTVVQTEAQPSRHGAVFGLASATFATSMMAAVALAPALNYIGDPSMVLGVGAGALVLAAAIAFRGSRLGAAVTPSTSEPRTA